MTTANCWIVGDDDEHMPEFFMDDVTEEQLLKDYSHVVRRKDWDKYAPSVPIQVMLDEGWWVYCSWCEHQVSDDGCSDCADKHDSDTMAPPVILASDVFCSQECHDAYHDENVRYAMEKQRIEREGTKLVLDNWPDAYEIRVCPQDTQINHYEVEFKVPWLKYGGVRFSPEKKCVWVAYGDQDAWNEHEKERRA